MTDSPHSDRPRSAETAQEIREQEIERRLRQGVRTFPRVEVQWLLHQLRAAQEAEAKEYYLRMEQVLRANTAEARITELESILQAQASSGSPGAAPGADAYAEPVHCHRCGTPILNEVMCDDCHYDDFSVAAQPPASAPSVATTGPAQIQIQIETNPTIIGAVNDGLRAVTLDDLADTKLATTGPDETTLEQDIASALNRHCAENGSNTPDFILAEYLLICLAAFNQASRSRERWYGQSLSIGGQAPPPDAPTRG